MRPIAPLFARWYFFQKKQYRGVALLRQRHAVKPVHLRWGVKGAYGRYRLGMAGAISAQHLFRSV